MAQNFTLADVVANYLTLLAWQYRGKPKAVSTMTLLLQPAVCNYEGAALAEAFNLATAVGPQLDIIGKYVGASRLFKTTVTANYYGFQNYSGTGNNTGWRNYLGITNPTGVWFSYQFVNLQNNYLPDSIYRQVIQLQIILNSNDGTLASIMAYLQRFFPGQVSLVDTTRMELIYTIQPSCQLSTAILRAYLPKPMGVGITINDSETVFTRVLMDGTTIRVLTDGSTERVTQAL